MLPFHATLPWFFRKVITYNTWLHPALRHRHNDKLLQPVRNWKTLKGHFRNLRFSLGASTFMEPTSRIRTGTQPAAPATAVAEPGKEAGLPTRQAVSQPCDRNFNQLCYYPKSRDRARTQPTPATHQRTKKRHSRSSKRKRKLPHKGFGTLRYKTHASFQRNPRFTRRESRQVLLTYLLHHHRMSPRRNDGPPTITN